METKKRGNSKVWLLSIVGIGAILLVILAVWMTNGRKKSSDTIMDAVYLKDEEGNHLFVDLKNEVPFTGTFPEGGILNEKGDKIAKEDLQNGDLVEIHGNNIMLQSLPGQYPGITKIVRKESQNKEMLDKYGEWLAKYTVKVDPTQLPYLSLEYRQPEAVVTASVSTYGTYRWEYETETGETSADSAEGTPVYLWDTYTDIKLAEPTELKLTFSKSPKEVQVIRYEASVKDKVKETPNGDYKGETVPVEQKEDGPAITAEPGFIYSVKAAWDNGEAEYGFQTLKTQ